jgi:catechol 2,3-dioxygenase-like lactoylglutathione lyase family enzyme
MNTTAAPNAGLLDLTFTAKLIQEPGKGGWTYVVMEGSADFFATRGLVKVDGTIDDQPFTSSFMALDDGTHKRPVNAPLRRRLGKHADDTVTVHLDRRLPHPQPDNRRSQALTSQPEAHRTNPPRHPGERTSHDSGTQPDRGHHRFVEHLEPTRRFNQEVFGLEVIYQDDVSAVVALENLMINLLQASNASTLVEPRTVGGPGSDQRALLTIPVDDTNAVCAQLRQHGVTLLNGPVDHPWGRRTAAFADPAGSIWEVAQVLADT